MVSISANELTDAVMGRLLAVAQASPPASSSKAKDRMQAGTPALPVFTGVSIDSRTVKEGEVFFALLGRHLDGHDFIPDAMRNGAAGAVVGTPYKHGVPSQGDFMRELDNGFVVVVVEDTTRALQNLSKWHRRRFSCPIAAVTGSNGKTTTKDLTWSILSRMYRTLRNQGTKNNHIGLPLTLLELDEGTEAAVVELGTSRFGEIRDLVSICSPDLGCITNIGPAHLEFFGDVKNVAKAKAELLEGMRDGCPVVLNADDAWYEWLRSRAKGPVVTFGIYHPADFMAEDIRAADGSVTFRIAADFLGVRRYIRLPFGGAHNAYNALAAAAISSQFGAGILEIKEGLREARLPTMRYEVISLSGVTVVNDAYNANPVSTMCALSSFCQMDIAGRRIFVCGDMLELGKHAREAHRQVGFFIAGQPIDYVIAFGKLASEVGEAAFGQRAQGERWSSCHTVEDVVCALLDVVAPGDAVLIKGSRANGMERIVEALKTELSDSLKETAKR